MELKETFGVNMMSYIDYNNLDLFVKAMKEIQSQNQVQEKVKDKCSHTHSFNFNE